MAHEKTTKESIRDILYDLEVDDPAQAITDESIEKAINRIDLLISTLLRSK